MLNKSYNILNNGVETLIAVNVIKNKKDDKISFLRDNNDLVVMVNNKKYFCYKSIPYKVWGDINNNLCFLVEFGPFGAIEEYNIILN